MNFRRWILRILPWLALFGAFVAFGCWVRSVQPWSPVPPLPTVELYAMDYRRYSQMLGDWHMILYAAFRHPLYCLLMSPVIGVASHLRTLGEWPYWIWLISFFSAVMTLAHFLVYWLLRRLSLSRLEAAALTALFASFAASWLLAACPESFNISCLLALATLHFALYVHRHSDTIDRQLEYAGWGALALFTGGITSTQVVKTAMAYFVTRRPKLKTIIRIALGILAAGILVGIVFSVRLYLRVGSERYAAEYASALHNIGAFFVEGGLSVSHRLGRYFVFFTDPVIARGTSFSDMVIPTGYDLPPIGVLALLPAFAAVISAWFARRHFVVRLIAAMFLVDFGIHFILFWGMDEAQIYAGHWYYALPILIGLGLCHLSSRFRRLAPLVIAALALTILALNLRAWQHYRYTPPPPHPPPPIRRPQPATRNPPPRADIHGLVSKLPPSLLSLPSLTSHLSAWASHHLTTSRYLPPPSTSPPLLHFMARGHLHGVRSGVIEKLRG